jgi:uncharacterized protein (UPF0264 family)
MIDVKDPSQGSLGPSDTSTIANVIYFVNGRVPVSAARGELAEHAEVLPHLPLQFVKWGLAKSGLHWSQELLIVARRQLDVIPECRLVAVAYADWQLAESPSPGEVLSFVRKESWNVFLLDTWKKNGRSLLDWMSFREIRRLCQECRQGGIDVALAGSLGKEQISQLLPLEPDIFAVRGAVCREKNRRATVDSHRVRELADILSISPAIHEN